MNFAMAIRDRSVIYVTPVFGVNYILIVMVHERNIEGRSYRFLCLGETEF